ncbi:LysM peptidoglycan-binding domain-containing protein [Pseudogemmobacter faecipullorum]|nr:LysM peptidoglycan-binding domain-containing protein [Pseudogemmobacter faecipullorum]
MGTGRGLALLVLGGGALIAAAGWMLESRRGMQVPEAADALIASPGAADAGQAEAGAAEEGQGETGPGETGAAEKEGQGGQAAAAPAPAGPALPGAADAPPGQADPPRITTWLVTPAGHATISGLALPGSEVEILLEGAALAQTRTSTAGEFALVTTIAPDPAPRVMSLVMVLENGERIPGASRVVIGPIAGPAPVALAREASGEKDAAPEVLTSGPPVALLVTGQGALVLQQGATSGAPAAATVAIETITYPGPDLVQIGGSGQPGSFIRLYLDNQPAGAESLVGPRGKWLASLSDLAPGLYLLRADQLNAAGEVTARAETPFRRETPEALASASAGALLAGADSPAEGAESAAPPEAGLTPAILPARPDEGAAPEPVSEPVPEPVLAESDLAASAPEAPVATGTEAAPRPDASVPRPVSVTVQPGHTLWSIARGEWGEGVMYVQLWEANRDRIRDPDLIYPGQVFTIPLPGSVP